MENPTKYLDGITATADSPIKGLLENATSPPHSVFGLPPGVLDNGHDSFVPSSDNMSPKGKEGLPFQEQLPDKTSPPAELCGLPPKGFNFGQPLLMSSPSPARTHHSSHARSEWYMKSVMHASSPYAQRTFTPMSATPSGFSPAYRTPIRSNKNSPLFQGPSHSHGGTPLHSSGMSTPGTIQNPFNEHVLSGVIMSPGVFAVCATPESEEKKPFAWSIEHIAELKPVEIDEMPKQQSAHHKPGSVAEAKAQEAIRNFFTNNLIAPSPWTENQTKTKCMTVTPDSDERNPVMHLQAELQGSIQKQLPKKSLIRNQQDAVCQTVLSIPVGVDLSKELSQYMTNETNEDVNQEILSTSSLRRKLFFQGDTSSVAPSPVKGPTYQNDHKGRSPTFSPDGSPMSEWSKTVPHGTPNRNQFSSSPIKITKDFAVIPDAINCSPSADFLVSPELSPIIHGHRLSRTRTNNMVIPYEGSFEESHMPWSAKASGQPPRLASPEISPIGSNLAMKFNADDECGEKDIFLASPALSPICLKNSPSSPREENDEEEDVFSFSSPEETPIPDRDRGAIPKICPISSRKVSHLTRHQNRGKKSLQGESDRSLMEHDQAEPKEDSKFLEDASASICQLSKDMSFTDMEYTNDNIMAPNSTNHDTGYQTGSLQLTNQETGLHTNLTAQFSSFPFNTTSMESGNHTQDSNSASDSLSTHGGVFKKETSNDSAFQSVDNIQDSAESSKPLMQKLLDLTNVEDCEKIYSEEEILDRARQALDTANSILAGLECKDDYKKLPMTQEDIATKKGLHILHELEPIISPSKSGQKSYFSKEILKEKHSTSERALEILKRAGEDLFQFGTFKDKLVFS